MLQVAMLFLQGYYVLFIEIKKKKTVCVCVKMKDPIYFYIFRLLFNFSEEYTIYELNSFLL